MAGRQIVVEFLGKDKSLSSTARKVEGSTSSISGKLSKFGKAAAIGLGGVATGFGLIAKKSIGLEAEFGKTMNVLQSTLKVPQSQMKSLTDLAIKMGNETTFSANDASKAMLELARGGMTAASIQGGALKGTLTLAAAGEMDMATAANTAVKAIGAFNLKGKDMASVAAALAGGANASAASVSDMSQALAQGGLAAHNAGLSLQETTAILASFSNHGLNGSDAGTSLKTMLTNLQPATDKAANAFRKLGIANKQTGSAFVKSNGDFKSAAQIAELLHKGTAKLSEAERTRYITQAFGTDAQRAANIMADEGAAGMKKLLKQTSDTSAAQKMAAANMKGTAGAMERLSGSVETLELMLGRALAPMVQKVANYLANDFLPPLTNTIAAFSDGSKSASGLTNSIRGAVGPTSQFGKTLAAVGGFLKSLAPTFVSLGKEAKSTLGPAFSSLGQVLNSQFLPAFRSILPVVGPIAKFLLKAFGESVIGVISGLAQAVKGLAQVFSGFVNLIDDLFHGRWSKIWGDLKQITVGALNAVFGVFKVWWYGSVLAIFRRAGLMLTKGLWVNMFKSLSSFAKTGMERIGGVFKGGLGAIWRVVWGGVKSYLGLWRSLFNLLRESAVAGWKALRSAFGGAMSGIRTAFSTFFGGLKSAAKNGLDSIISAVKSVPSRISNLASSMLNSGKEFMGKFFDGIKSAASGAGGFVADLAYKLKSAINNILHLPLDVNFDKGPIHIHATVIPALAKGTKNFAGGLALVGEEGPELVSMPRGSAVHTAAQTRRMVSGGDTYNIYVNGALDPDAVARQIQTVLLRRKRTTGRTLGLA